jgi:hypothetical protein
MITRHDRGNAEEEMKERKKKVGEENAKREK